MSHTCPECGCEYSELSKHWYHSSCDYPQISENQYEVITGLLMGDATLGYRERERQRVVLDMTNQDFVRWVDQQLGVLTTGYRKLDSKSHCRRDTSFTSDSPEFKDVYRVSTWTMPGFERYVDWYGNNGKMIPVDVELTPTTLKMWYCSDGDLKHNKTSQNGRPRLRLSARSQDKGVMMELFAELGCDPTWCGGHMTFNVADSGWLWDYMGHAPPGFGYKWPSESL